MAYTASTALAAARDSRFRPGLMEDYLVNPGATIYKGGMVGILQPATPGATSGYAHAYADNATGKDVFVGIAEETVVAPALNATLGGIDYNDASNPAAVTGIAAGAGPYSRVRVRRHGIHRVGFLSDTDTSTAAKLNSLIGAAVYATSDAAVSDLTSGTTYYSQSGTKVGYIVAWESAAAAAGTLLYCYIQIDNAVS